MKKDERKGRRRSLLWNLLMFEVYNTPRVEIIIQSDENNSNFGIVYYYNGRGELYSEIESIRKLLYLLLQITKFI